MLLKLFFPLLFSLISHITGAGTPGDSPRAELLFVGDAMQHQSQLDAALKCGNPGEYDYTDCFALIAPDVMAADFAVCNFETTIGVKGDFSGYPCFSTPASYALALKNAGFDLFLTSNNHCLDRSDKGLRRTITMLDSLRIDHIGTYHDRKTREQLPPYIKKVKGIAIGFCNYTYGTNGITPKSGAEVAMINRTEMARDIKALREAGAELVIATVHWGNEYQLKEHSTQRDLARFLVAQGVDAVIGGHPHVVQPMVMMDGQEGRKVPVIYSLGNFISAMRTGDTRGGALVKLVITRDAEGRAIVESAAYDTFFAAKPEGQLKNFQVVPSRLSHLIPQGQQQYWKTFKTSADRVFSTNSGIPAIQY